MDSYVPCTQTISSQSTAGAKSSTTISSVSCSGCKAFCSKSSSLGSSLDDLLQSAFQPKSEVVPPKEGAGRRYKFQHHWYSDYKWLHYSTELKGMLCVLCHEADRLKLFSPMVRMETAFTDSGFRNWKKGCSSLCEHNNSDMHKDALTKLTGVRSDLIDSRLSEAEVKSEAASRTALGAIFTSLKYLAWQGIAVRAHDPTNANFDQLLKLRAQDIPELMTSLNVKKKHLTSPDMQNEMMQIMAHEVLLDVLKDIGKTLLYSIIVDESTDVAGHEQVSICVRYVDETLLPEEFFLGFVETSITIGHALTQLITDVLCRLGLPPEYLRGQCYDGAANIYVLFKGTQARILQRQPLALYVHCANHCANLACQDLAKSVPLVRETLQIVNEVGVLIRNSAKRTSIFSSFVQMHDMACSTPRPLCPTRWTVRVAAISRVLDSYEVVLETLDDIGSSTSDTACQARGLRMQLQKGEVVFGLFLCLELFTPTDDLSTILQRSSMSVGGAKQAVNTVLASLQSIRNDKHFDALWEKMLIFLSKYDLDQPQERRQCRPLRRLAVDMGLTGAPGHTFSAKSMHQKAYLEAVDVIIAELEHRFDQPGFDTCMRLEQASLAVEHNSSHEEICDLCGYDRHIQNQLAMFHKTFRDENGPKAVLTVDSMATRHVGGSVMLNSC